MHIKVDANHTQYCLPIEAISLRTYISSSGTRIHQCVFSKDFVNTADIISITPQEYDRIKDTIKKSNMLEAEEINNKAGKEIVSPKFVNTIMGLEV